MRARRRALLNRQRDERGFTVIETMVALAIILAALVALAYTAGIGFSRIAYARQTQTATGLANQTMEQTRALPFAILAKGLGNADLASGLDSNITLSGGNYMFEGERIPHGDNPSIVPLVPHRQIVTAGTATAYTVSVYVTSLLNVPTNNTYRVTVLVTWAAAGRTTPAHVKVQSVFFAGSGCLSGATHPFAAPCQPFFFGSAHADEGRIAIAGSLAGVDFSEGDLVAGLWSSDTQLEQVSAVQGLSETSGATVTSSAGTATVGLQKVSSGADSDPASDSDAYSTTTTPLQGSLAVTAGGGGNSLLTLTSGAGDTGATTSTTSASISPANLCTDPAGVSQTDKQPCGNSAMQVLGTSTGTLQLWGDGKKVGTMTLGSVGPSPTKGVAYTDRAVAPEFAICPTTTGEGCEHSEVSHSWGTVTLAGLPDGLDPTALPPGWLGYLVSATGMTATASADVGIGAAKPTLGLTGTLSLWNGSGYTTVTLAPGASTPLSVAPVHITSLFNAKVLDIVVTSTLATGGTVLTDPAGCVSSCTRTTASGQVNSPIVGDISYVVTLGGETLADLSIHVDLGSALAKGTYQKAPSGG